MSRWLKLVHLILGSIRFPQASLDICYKSNTCDFQDMSIWAVWHFPWNSFSWISLSAQVSSFMLHLKHKWVYYTLWIKIQIENSISSALLFSVFLIYIHLSWDLRQHAWILLCHNYIITKKVIFNLKMSIFGTQLFATKKFLEQVNSQLGQCKSGTFHLDKRFLDLIFPLNATKKNKDYLRLKY